MIAYGKQYPYTCSPDDILLAQQKEEFSNYLCSDVQVRGEYSGFAKRFFRENNINFDKGYLLLLPSSSPN